MDVFSALADPIRRELLIRLSEGAARVVDLSAAHTVSRPAISRHLRVLSDAGLVRAMDQGRERHYELDPGPLANVGALVDRLVTGRQLISEHHLDAGDGGPAHRSRPTTGTRTICEPELHRQGAHRMNPTGRLEDEGRTLVLRRRLPVPIDDVWASITESERLAGGSARGLATRRRVR